MLPWLVTLVTAAASYSARAQPPIEIPIETVTSEAITNNLKLVDESPDLSDEQKTQYRRRYERALQLLREAESSAEKAKQFTHDAQTAADALARIMSQRAALPLSATVHVEPDEDLSSVKMRLEKTESKLDAARKTLSNAQVEPDRRAARMKAIPAELAAAAVEKIVPVTALDLIVVLLILAMTYVAAKNVPGLLEMSILQRLPLDSGLRFTIVTITRYAIVITGVIVSCNRFGVAWSKVQWLIAALTVGLGFGLQEIFANFVSGIILLVERPVRVGDLVTIGDINGTVTQIRMRATTVRDWNRRELIVPNKDLITGKLINWTLGFRFI